MVTGDNEENITILELAGLDEVSMRCSLAAPRFLVGHHQKTTSNW